MALRCPDCNCAHSKVTNTWEHEITVRGRTYVYVRRRRVCRHCGRAYYGKEYGEEDVSPKTEADEPPPPPGLPKENPFL